MIRSLTMPILGRIAAAFASIALVASLLPAAAFAVPEEAQDQNSALSAQANNEIKRGTSGQCTWIIDDSGKLTVRPSSGSSGKLASFSTAPWSGYAEMITSANIASGVSGNTSIAGMFAGCKNLTSINLRNFNTSAVKDMSRMFENCATLPVLDLKSLKTSSTTNMEQMFDGCSRLTKLDASSFDTASVTDMSAMFRACSSLTTLKISSFNTANVTDMSDMFKGCSTLSSLDVSNFKTEKVENMDRMFSALELTELDLSSFNTPSLKNMWGMFYACSSLKKLNISKIDTSQVASMGYLFDGCYGLRRVELGSAFAFDDETSFLPKGKWISATEGTTFNVNQIAAARKNTADKYVKSRTGATKPTITKGSGLVWLKGASEGAAFSSSAELDDFACVKIDGKVIAQTNYTVGGSSKETNVTLRAAYLESLSLGSHEIGIMSATGTASAKFTIDNDSEKYARVEMYRLYNPNSGEHFYTASTVERDSVRAAGWKYEGIGWVAPKTGDPVYRLYNKNGGEHHYTPSKVERDSLVKAGWKYEGIGWYSAGSVPLHRQYNPNAFANNHNYTTSVVEKNHLIKIGWKNEGIAWYAMDYGRS